MRTYSFDCLDALGQICRVHVLRCIDDEHALAEAQTMLGGDASCFAVEVWTEGGLVGSRQYEAAAA